MTEIDPKLEEAVQKMYETLSDTDKITLGFLNLIRKERNHQNQKWGTQNHHPAYWMSILGEEYGEACQLVNELYLQPTDSIPVNSENLKKLQVELIQVAAVACAAAESLQRNEVEGILQAQEKLSKKGR